MIPSAPNPLLWLLLQLIGLYGWVLIIWIVMSWLTTFGIVNQHQPFVSKINYVLYRLTEPLLVRIRPHMPAIGGIDLSPIVLFIGLNLLEYSIIWGCSKAPAVCY